MPVLEVDRNNRTTALCSKRDPEREAQRVVESHLKGNELFVLLFGLGLGYVLEEMLRTNSDAHYVIVEPDLELFSEIIKTRDISHILLSKRCTLLVEPKRLDLDSATNLPPTVKLAHIVLRTYRTLYGAEAFRVERDFIAFANSKKINRATLKRFDRLWTRNTFKNCYFFFTYSGVSLLSDRFKGMAAIVVAAGPSIEMDLPLLRRYSSDCVVIAVDTVVNTLLRQNIRPDFAVTVDPQMINSHHLAGISAPYERERLPILVADPAVYPTVFRTYGGDVLLTSSVFNPGRIIEQFTEIKGNIAAGGSVATAAFDLARILGADPIFLMGLDLSFSGLKTHISGSAVERYIQTNAHRLKTVHTYTSAYIKNGNPARYKDKTGAPVLSDSRMKLYKNWFERQMVHERTTVLNASRRGLHIEGMPDITADHMAARIPYSMDKGTIMKELRSVIGRRPMLSEGAQRFLQYLGDRQDQLSIIETLAQNASACADSLKKDATPESTAKLSSLEAQILSFTDCSRLIDMVIQEPINEALSQTAADDMDMALDRSIDLYNAIEDAAVYLKGVLSMAEKRMKQGLVGNKASG
jgi:hypothetical protein